MGVGFKGLEQPQYAGADLKPHILTVLSWFRSFGISGSQYYPPPDLAPVYGTRKEGLSGYATGLG